MSFRNYLVENNIISKEDFDKIIKIYDETDTGSGKKKLFEDIAVELGYLDEKKREEEFLKYCQEN
jgi:hypothetical protein